MLTDGDSIKKEVDLSDLSKHGLDESHHTPSVPVITKRVPGNKYKSTLVAKMDSGIELHILSVSLSP